MLSPSENTGYFNVFVFFLKLETVQPESIVSFHFTNLNTKKAQYSLQSVLQMFVTEIKPII